MSLFDDLDKELEESQGTDIKKKDSFLKKTARFFLPKSLEKKFGVEKKTTTDLAIEKPSSLFAQLNNEVAGISTEKSTLSQLEEELSGVPKKLSEEASPEQEKIFKQKIEYKTFLDTQAPNEKTLNDLIATSTDIFKTHQTSTPITLLKNKPQITPLTQEQLENPRIAKAYYEALEVMKEPSLAQKLKNGYNNYSKSLERVSKNIAIGELGTASSMLGFAEWVGVDSAKPIADKIDNWIQTSIQKTGDPTLGDQIAQGIGSGAIFFIPGMGASKLTSIIATQSPRIASLFGGSISALLEAMAESGNTYRAVKEVKGEKEAGDEATKSFLLNALLVGITNRFGVFNPDTTGFIKRTLMSAPLEGVQEFAQQLISNSAEDKPLLEGAGTSFIVGTIVGGLMGGTVDLLSGDAQTRFVRARDIVTGSDGVVFDVEKAITDGKVKAEQIYSDQENKVLQPDFAQNQIDSVARTLDTLEQGLGTDFRNQVDLNNTTQEEIQEKAVETINKLEKGELTPELLKEIKLIPAVKEQTQKAFEEKTKKKVEEIKEKAEVEDLSAESEILRGTKGMTADDIMKTYPNIKLTKDLPAKDIYGNKVEIPDGEVLTPYELKGNKVLLQDGQAYVVSKNQFENIKGNSISGEAKPFAPELQGTEETVKAERKLTKLEIKELNELPDIDKMTDKQRERFNELSNIEGIGVTKYSQYQLPGGENYKEILVKAKENINPEDLIVENGEIINRNSQNFKSSHWDELNVLLHLRMNERTYKGKDVSFLEEIQSDWARENRKLLGVDEQMRKDNPDVDIKQKELGDPLLKNWQELAVKRALTEAVNIDADYFSWINGEQTSARYNLSTQIENVSWNEINNQKLIDLTPISGIDHIVIRIDEKGKIILAKDNAPADWKGKNLDEVIGKGLADKIMVDKTGDLSGEGLKFGGEWAINLYDKQIANIVKDLTGAEIETLDLGLPIETKIKAITYLKNGRNLQLTEKDLKIGKQITIDNKEYIITGVLKDGKFKAVSQHLYDLNGTLEKALNKESYTELKTGGIYKTDGVETFDISKKLTTQQGIKLTPEIKARIKGEDLGFKTKGEKFETTKVKKLKVKNIGLKTKSNQEVSILESEIVDIYKGAGESSVEGFTKADEVLSDLFNELELSEPGSRILTEDTGVFARVKGSTFPQWIPQEFREKKLFEKIFANLDLENLKMPRANKTKQRALFNVLLDYVDMRLGVDTSTQRQKINKIYEKGTKKEDTKGNRGGVERGQDEITPEDILAEFEKPKKQDPKFKVGQSITGLGEIKEIVIQENGLIQYKTGANNWTAENVVENLMEAEKIKKKSVKSDGGVLGFNPINLTKTNSKEGKAELEKIVKRSDIAKKLVKGLGITVKHNSFRNKALGIFKPSHNVIRLKSNTGNKKIQVLVHESAHYIDSNLLGDPKENLISKNVPDKELDSLVVEYSGGSKLPKSKKQKEAFAEFVRFWVTEPTRAESIAPEFSKYWDSLMEQFPETRDVLLEARHDWKSWIDQPAVAKVRSQISFAHEKAGIIDTIKTKWHQLYSKGVDDLHPLQEFVKLAETKIGKIETEKNPYILARLLRGWVGKANVFLEQGTFRRKFWSEEDGKSIPKFEGKSLQDIVTPFEKAGTLEDFSVYLISKRSIRLASRKIQTGIDPKDAQIVIKELEKSNPEFIKGAEELDGYQDDLLIYGFESGLYDAEFLKKMKKMNQDYVPFYRVMEELEVGGFMGKAVGGVKSPIKRIKGSELDIINPIEGIIKNTYAIVNASERNQVALAMVNLSTKHPEIGRLFEKIPEQLVKVASVKTEEVMKSAFGNDFVNTLIENVSKEEVGEVLDKMIDVWRPSMFEGNNTLTVLVKGKKQHFSVDPDIYSAMQGLEVEDAGMIIKFLSWPSKFLRVGATLTPEFMLRNPVRDQMSAVVYSKYGYLPVIDMARGFYSLAKKDDSYWLWRMAGGEHAMLVSMDREYLEKSYNDVIKDKKGGLLSRVRHPIETLQIFSEFGEQGTRLGEAKKALISGANPLDSAFASREVTLDFARMGAKTRVINMLVAFWNANIQGTDKMIRSFKETPYKTTTKTMLAITLPSILLYMINRDDPRWDEIPQWQKNIFWIVMTENHIFRIPKPFELGVIFGSIPERILESIDKEDPELFSELTKAVRDGATPGFLPTFLLPIVENITNHSFFLNRDIVSQGREALPGFAQYGNYTSETSKSIGKWINYSPAKIDNLIKGYFAGLGTYALQTSDTILEKTGIINSVEAPAMKLSDWPLIKAFSVREPIGGGSESVSRLYDKAENAQNNKNHFTDLKEEGKTEEAKEWLADHPEIEIYKYLNKVKSQLSQLNKDIIKVKESDQLTSEQKRKKIDELERLMTDVAVKGLDMYHKKID